MTHYDLCVLGGGSGGQPAARTASSYGQKVCLVEGSRLGGTCVNVGCVPKKVMWNMCHVAEAHELAARYGFEVDMGEGATSPKFSWETIKKHRDAYVKRLNGIYERNLGRDEVEYVHGWGVFTGKNEVTVTNAEGEKTVITADKFILAPGGKPAIPSTPGAELLSNSDDFFAMEHAPKKVGVLGAGYIAVELFGVFQALGIDVTLFTRSQTILKQFDTVIGESLKREINRTISTHGVGKLHHDAKIVSYTGEPGNITVTFEDGTTDGGYDAIFAAIGRTPNTADIGLEKLGVELTPRGKIIADDADRTTAEHVWAVGDAVEGRVELTPAAIKTSRLLTARLFNGGSKLMNWDAIPSVVFSHPPCASVGISEAEAIKRYGADNVTVYKNNFINMYYSMMETQGHKPVSTTKLICAGEGSLGEQKVVGLHGVGMGSDEVIQGFGIALQAGATKEDFDNSLAVHPTAAEEFQIFRVPEPKKSA